MELVLKTDSDEQVELILAFAKKLNIIVESREKLTRKKERGDTSLSSLLAGSIDKKKAAELNRELENMRNE